MAAAMAKPVTVRNRLARTCSNNPWPPYPALASSIAATAMPEGVPRYSALTPGTMPSGIRYCQISSATATTDSGASVCRPVDFAVFSQVLALKMTPFRRLAD